jgi:hypothetical protein
MQAKCRLEALQRWERAWDVLRMRTLPRDVPCPEGTNSLTYTICDSFLIGVRCSPNPGYYYLSIHDSTRGDDNWTWVDFRRYGKPIACVFATEHNMTMIISISE